MKLPDFHRCVELKQLLVNMGVSAVSELKIPQFSKTVLKVSENIVPNPQVSFAQKLKMSSVSLNTIPFEIASDGTIEVHGLKACAYIKKQKQDVQADQGYSSYKYHLCNCSTIQYMVSSGKKDRYVSTTRDDGYFPVIDQSSSYLPAREHILKMELCANCIAKLKENGMYFTPFSLKKFFEKYQPDIPENIKQTEQVYVEEKYAPNHKEVADAFKLQTKYCCQICKVDCSAEHSCLHLHHKNGEGTDNRSSNLMVLCTDCHAHSPLHQHMLNNPKFLKQIRTIQRLRKQQGLN